MKKQIKAWAILKRDGNLHTHSYAGRIAIYSTADQAKDQKLSDERVVPVTITIEEEK